MQANKEKLLRRLKIIEGQVRGLQKMVSKDLYCIDIITQTSAVKQGLSCIEDELLRGHLWSCTANHIETKKAEEILKIYQLRHR